MKPKKAKRNRKSSGARTTSSSTYLIEKGEVDSVWQAADHIVKAEYTTGAQEQLYQEKTTTE